ncbi:DUF4139 domain-containing protein [Streptacidiphilus monticola]
MRALVAQRSTEDWSAVRLSLSTADLQRASGVPELKSLRLGRRQQGPVVPLVRRPPRARRPCSPGTTRRPSRPRTAPVPSRCRPGRGGPRGGAGPARRRGAGRAPPRAARRMAAYGGPPPAPGGMPAPVMAAPAMAPAMAVAPRPRAGRCPRLRRLPPSGRCWTTPH